MIIPISETRRIKSSTNQWAIQKRQKRGDKRIWESWQFYTSPEAAIMAAFDGEIRDLPDHLNFLEIIQEIKILRQQYKALLTIGDIDAKNSNS